MKKSPLYYPKDIYIETSSWCNLRCPNCYREIYNYEGKNKFLSFNSFQEIIDQISKAELDFSDKPRLFLHGIGEPTLNPELKKMIAYADASDNFHSIEFVTNLLTKSSEEYINYFSCGLTKLYVSIDHISMDFNSTSPRTGSDPLKVVENLKEVKNAIGLSNIAIITAIRKADKNCIEEIAKVVSEIGINEWCIQRIINYKSGTYYLNITDVAEIYNIAKGCVNHKTNINMDGLVPFKCNQPYTTLVINAMGFVTPCCLLFDHLRIQFGNVFSESCIEIFQSEIFNTFRDRFKNERPEACSICPMYNYELENCD